MDNSEDQSVLPLASNSLGSAKILTPRNQQQAESSEMIQNFIGQVNNLDPKKHFNPSSNISTSIPTAINRRRQHYSKLKGLGEISGLNDDSLQGIKFTKDDNDGGNGGDGTLKDFDQDLNNHVKDQLSILTTEFSHLNNFTFVSGIAHLALIGNRIMEKASIEANTQSILNMSGGSQILKQGYLLKAGPNAHQPWKKRYCVLTEACEFRYMSQIGQAPKGLFSIEGTWASRINSDNRDQIDSKDLNSSNTSDDTDNSMNDQNFNDAFKNINDAFQFQIETSGRTYKFQAPSYQSLKSWLDALDTIGCKVKIDESDGVVLKGNLMKERTSNHWSKRYVVLLESNELKYYGKKGSSLKGTIDLEDSYITKIIEKPNHNIVTNTIMGTFTDINANRYMLKIHTPERNHVFEAETEKELDQWIQNISKYGAIQRKETDPKPIFKNRLNKYYLKTTEQVIIERQEKLQEYIVSEDILRSKLERNKNNISFRINNSSVQSIQSNNSSVMSHHTNQYNHHMDHQTLSVQTATKRNSRAYAKSESSLLQQFSPNFKSLLDLKPGETPPPPTPVLVSPVSSLNASIIPHFPIEEALSDDEHDEEEFDIQVLRIEPIEKYIPEKKEPIEPIIVPESVHSDESTSITAGEKQQEEPSKTLLETSNTTTKTEKPMIAIEIPLDVQTASNSSDEFHIIVEDLTINHDIETINNIDNTDTDNVSTKSGTYDQYTISINNQPFEEEHQEPNEFSQYMDIDTPHYENHSYNMTNPPQPFTSYQIIPDLNPAIVIDNGSGILKAGFSNQDFPVCVFNNMIGRLKQYTTRGVGQSLGEGKLYFGDGAQSLRGVLQLSYPVERGIVKNFDDCEMMLQYTQDCLKLDTFSDHPLLITESTVNPKQNRERTTQIMFETFDVPFLYMAKSPVLSLFAHGYTTGLVLDSGDGVTHTVPIYEGFSLPHAVKRLELAGKDLTSYMLSLLNQSGQSPFHSQNSSSAIEIVRCLKEDLSFVRSFSDAKKNANINDLRVSYDLPDGTSISVGEERFKCPELLFNPSENGNTEMLGIHELCKKTIHDCDIDLRKTLAGNIFLSGGSTKFTGLQSRLQDEVQNLLPYSNKVKVKGSKDVQFLPWIGGAIISKISRFPYDCISRQEYEETGPHYCHVKFM